MMAAQGSLDGSMVKCVLCGQMVPRALAKHNRDGESWHSGVCYPIPIPEPRSAPPVDSPSCMWGERHEGWADDHPEKMSCIVHHHARPMDARERQAKDQMEEARMWKAIDAAKRAKIMAARAAHRSLEEFG